jgi:hypothetical protein
MDEFQKSPEEVIAEYKQARNSKRKKIILIVVGGFIALSVLGNLTDSGSESSVSTSENSTTVSGTNDSLWVPTGFFGYEEDRNLAWRWATESELNCTYSSGACWSMILLAKEGCSRSLYGEVNIFDKNDVQISYTNDTLGTVQPMQKVKLTFDTLDDAADTARLSRFSCY